MREIPNSSKMLAIIKFLVCFWGAIAIIIAKYYPKVSYPKVIFCVKTRILLRRKKIRLSLSIPFTGFGSRVSTVGCGGRGGV